MSLSQRISSLVHSLRKAHMLKVRQPLSKILIPVLNDIMERQVASVKDIILAEVNIKEIEFLKDAGILQKKIKANFKKLGKEYGAKMKDLANAIAAMSQEDIRVLEANNAFQLSIPETVNISLDDVELSFEDIPGWSVASEGNITVALDITITDELKSEGIARDVVNRVQNLRKDMGLDVQDKIRITIQRVDELINSALESNREYICAETQAISLELADLVSDGKSVEMDEQELIVKIEK